MTPCLSQATTMPSAFDADLRAYGQVGCTAVEIWLTKLETFLETNPIDAVKRLVAERELTLAAAAVHGGILLAQGDARREGFALLVRRLDLCRALRIPTLVLAADFVDDISFTDYERAVLSLKQAAQMAGDRGVRLALEFGARARFCNNLCTAMCLVVQCGEPSVGICFDVFQYYTGPSKFEDLAHLTRNNLFHVQLSDLAGVPRELATDSDRVLPGDGDFQLPPILDQFRSIGYDGYVSVELMNPQIWRLAAEQVAEVAITALRKLLGLAKL
ncbi:MAG: sugar phosphate isomerase/epimerase [Planctomycetes bacterium]|nr:sugar phosphate isomerase/epimerase [Planctomycetota bacterium]